MQFSCIRDIDFVWVVTEITKKKPWSLISKTKTRIKMENVIKVSFQGVDEGI